MTDQRTPEERLQSQEIREWARENGWPGLSAHGRIPAAAREAWEAAVGQPADTGYDELEDGGDVSSMDDSDLGDPAATSVGGWQYAANSTLVSGIVNAPVLPPDGDDLAPPVSLDEARERAGRDPEPAHLNRGRKTRTAREPKVKEPVKVTAAVRNDITGKLAFWLALPAEPWLRVDPYCGGVYADQVDQIALKMSPLICQSPDLVRWFSKSTTFILWTELGIAVRPVVEAIIAHHVTKRIALDSDGQAFEQQGGVDFSAYSARQPSTVAA